MGQRWAVVLAAGEGKRMHSQLPKALHPLCGRPMLDYVLHSAAAAAGKVIVVIGRGAAQVQAAMGPRWRYVLQERQLGTGDALMQALPLLPEEGQLLVLCGDTPLMGEDHLQGLLKAHDSNAATIMTAVLPDPTGYGRIIKDSAGRVSRIVEERDASVSEKQVSEINTGTYCFDLTLLKRFLPRISADNAQGEFYLTDVISLLTESGYRVGTYQLDDYRIGLGINDRAQLAEAAVVLRAHINRQLMLQGVTMVDPDSVYIDYGVRIGTDTVIWPQTVIEGDTEIGKSCTIGPGSHIKNARLGDYVVLRQSVVENCVLDDGATIGPFAFLRQKPSPT
ncbi:MAG TPA: bifunctional UDP-N-acetylglucosamine diphosphorylase/glucosamine-1-phosphate N-acetyltransferase GlmU [Bacillota bacterium]|nr:bifunctional UDP-N-acetylglucosamine diphosphorylase/glucosamine-1-phosphate N-acetyltransferase GlmU [Bacillota bacterium]